MESTPSTRRLPWWTWIAPLPMLQAGAWLSQLTQVENQSILFYLPIPIGIVFTLWWGPRVLASVLLHVLVYCCQYGFPKEQMGIMMLFNEVATVSSAWFLFVKLGNGKCWLPDRREMLYLLWLAVLIPVSVNATFIFLFGALAGSVIYTAMVWTSDFVTCFSIVPPLLFFLSPALERAGLTMHRGSAANRMENSFQLWQWVELLALALAITLASFFIPLEKYWYLHGVAGLYVSVRFGFGSALIFNLYIFLLTHTLPFITGSSTGWSWAVESSLINVHLGMCLLGVAATITGRVISDLKIVERRLGTQYTDLMRTHEELDRFVYSASHDLSAPLKSILGLINLSRMENTLPAVYEHLNRMEASVHRQERFIHEILDYSRNSRSEQASTLIDLETLTHEIINDIRFRESVQRTQFDLSNIGAARFYADLPRLKIILSNLLSNAVKYHVPDSERPPWVRVESECNSQRVVIRVADNGAGIPMEIQDSVFQMFFRGTTQSEGSGLGLYIAQSGGRKDERKDRAFVDGGHRVGVHLVAAAK
ncbi:MAG: HAMP domain-containing histidine kinase [Bacteroidia bacterium]|nr:HAMP domain-containing histidine kinase [Bacteroidia bacterium]